MGWEDPIGKKISQGRRYDAEVIAVVKDFHFFSLHNKIEPMLIRMQRYVGGNLIIEINGEDIGLFTLALFGAIAIALITASFNSIKVAKTNPAQSLRYE